MSTIPRAAVALGKLLADAGIPAPAGAALDQPIGRVADDSREAGPGTLFVAIPGATDDGHEFVADATARGAVAVIAQRPVEAGVPVIVVEDTRVALGALAAACAGDPSRRLVVAGITGTDGKTITTTMLWAAWRGAAIRAGSMSTVDWRSGESVIANPTRRTTLGAVEIQDHLRAMLDQGCTHVALETSSHALEMDRVAGVDFDVAVYTRITSEHLELHRTRERYLAAKRRLIESLRARPGTIAVLDADDAFAYPALSRIRAGSTLSYSASGAPGADLIAESVSAGGGALRFVALTPWGRAEVKLGLQGRFNVANSLAALAAACSTGAGLGQAVEGVESLDRVPGRLERLDLGQPFSVVIDYAHTADGLATVLSELRETTRGRLWAVFGSAGDRDRSKRPAMGAVADRLADRVVLTDEDPREEDRQSILEEIAGGFAVVPGLDRRLSLIPDRAQAIRFAIESALPGDTILLAGKGHESSLIRGRESLPWDERAVAEQAIQSRGWRAGTPARRG